MLELVEIDDRHGQMQRRRALRDPAPARDDLQSLGRVLRHERRAASVEHFDLFPLAHAHDVRVMLLVAAQRDGGAGGEVGVDEEAVFHSGLSS